MLNIVVLALAMTCESLIGLQLPHTSITSAATVAAGPLSDTVAVIGPARCEVKAVTRANTAVIPARNNADKRRPRADVRRYCMYSNTFTTRLTPLVVRAMSTAASASCLSTMPMR